VEDQVDHQIKHLLSKLNSGRDSEHIRVDGCVLVQSLEKRLSVRTEKASGTSKFRALADVIYHAFDCGLMVQEVLDESPDGFTVILESYGTEA
jgi:hypothetical protein